MKGKLISAFNLFQPYENQLGPNHPILKVQFLMKILMTSIFLISNHKAQPSWPVG